MVTNLNSHQPPHRHWNGRDDINQHYMGRVPETEHTVTLGLTWKREKGSRSFRVGEFRFEMKQLEEAGFVRRVPGYYILRFQRSGRTIQLATNRAGASKSIGHLPAAF